MTNTRRAVGLALVLAVTAACGHPDPQSLPAGGASGEASADAAAGNDATATNTGPGDFGTARAICGPGNPSGSPARGVTGKTIQIGVLNDATNTILPGVGQEWLDVAKAFTGWCNKAGGINGRKISFVNRDAQITQAPARIIDACQSDFMLVGGATVLDDVTVAPRVKCGMGSIPAYSLTTKSTRAPLTAPVVAVPEDESNGLLVRRLIDKYPNAMQKVAVLAVDVPSLLQPSLVAARAIPVAGGKVVSTIRLPGEIPNFRTFVQPLLGKAEAMTIPATDLVGLLRAIADVGLTPDVMFDMVTGTYTPDLIDALAQVPTLTVPFYIQTGVWPFELAEKNPATALAIKLASDVDSSMAKNPAIVQGFAAWILFAQSATACENKLTVKCVVDQAKTETAFDAGGLTVPRDVSHPQSVSPCAVIMSADAKGFAYDEKLTRPTDRVFNCDPKNVIQVKPS